MGSSSLRPGDSYVLRSSTGPREAESAFLSFNYFGVPNKALFYPYNKQTSSFGLFHMYAWVRVVPCINIYIYMAVYVHNMFLLNVANCSQEHFTLNK